MPIFANLRVLLGAALTLAMVDWMGFDIPGWLMVVLGVVFVVLLSRKVRLEVILRLAHIYVSTSKITINTGAV